MYEIVLDTETTGLEPGEGHRIVEIGAVELFNHMPTGRRFHRYLNPDRPMPPEALAVHGLTDVFLADKPRFEEVVAEFLDFLGRDSRLVIHNAAFDIKFLRMKEAVSGVALRNPVMDTLVLSLLLDGPQAEHSLDAIAERLGVQVKDRHTALGDARATAEILVRMIDRLEAKGIVTLAQAMEASNMTVEMREREAAF